MFLFGEQVNIGIGGEAVRGTPVAPSIWVPGRTPTGVKPVLEKTIIRETRGTRAHSQSSETTQKRAEGSLEFNLRSNSIHHVLKSLLGSAEGSVKAGETEVYEYEYRVSDDAQHPTLTLALANALHKSFRYPKTIATALEIRTPVSDVVNATAMFVSKQEQEMETPYVPAFTDDDYLFRNYEVTIKLAANVAGLAAAPALKVKEYALSIVNNGRVNQNIGELNPDDVIGLMLEITGSMSLDFTDETIRDIYTEGEYRALQLTLERDTTIGEESTPGYVFTLPKVSFENWTPDRPIDDIVRDGIEFRAHWSEDDSAQILVDGVNTVADDIEESA